MFEIETFKKLNKVYIAKGQVDYVTFKDNYNSTPIIVFNTFEDELSMLVAQLKISQSLKQP